METIKQLRCAQEDNREPTGDLCLVQLLFDLDRAAVLAGDLNGLKIGYGLPKKYLDALQLALGQLGLDVAHRIVLQAIYELTGLDALPHLIGVEAVVPSGQF